jgi:hypothetical protein
VEQQQEEVREPKKLVTYTWDPNYLEAEIGNIMV